MKLYRYPKNTSKLQTPWHKKTLKILFIDFRFGGAKKFFVPFEKLFSLAPKLKKLGTFI